MSDARASDAAPRVVHLDELPLQDVVAHGGDGRIGFRRVLGQSARDAQHTAGAWHFVDYAVLPPGASIGLHAHGENEELYLVLQGEGLMQLGDRSVRVRAGHLIVNPPGGTHGLRNDGNVPLRLFVVEVPLAVPPHAALAVPLDAPLAVPPAGPAAPFSTPAR